MLREELAHVSNWGERHRRLVARMLLIVVATLIVDAIGTVLIFVFERHADGTHVHTVFDAFFFTTVQLLTVSSQLPNPFTTGGRIVDIFLEMWGVLVVAGTAGAFASFATQAD